MKLAVVIPYYNGDKYIQRCLESLEGYGTDEIIIIDNSEIRRQLNVKAQVIKTNSSRIGFAAAVNLGLKKLYNSEYTHVLILNQDAYFKKGHFQDLLHAIGAKDIEENRPDTMLDNFASPMIYTEDFSTIMPFIKNRYFNDDIPENPFFINDFVAVALIAPLSLMKRLDGFDESYFMYYEDNDLIARSKLENAVTIFPGIHVGHANPDLDGNENNEEKEAWIRRSKIKYLWRHGNKYEWFREMMKWEIKKLAKKV